LGRIHFGNPTDSSLAGIFAGADGAADAAFLAFYTEATTAAIAERMRIASTGELVVAHTAAAAGGYFLQVADAGGGYMALWRPDSEITADNVLGQLAFGGDEGSDFYRGAAVTGKSSQAWTGAAKGTYLSFEVTADGATSLTEVVRITAAGDINVLAGAVNTLATAAGGAGLNLPHGTAPSSPVDGDIWTTTAGLYVRINGSTVGPLS
jgi:hypothetical protein